MSRFGKIPVVIPSGVDVKAEGRKVHIKGPKGAFALELPMGLSVTLADGKAMIVKDEKSSLTSAMHGLHRALFNNMIMGAFRGFEVKLTMVGVGYRAAVEGQNLNLQVGNSHPTKLTIPKGVSVAVDKNGVISVAGVDKHLVGQFAATIRKVKPPEPYKGKGIRYEKEHVRKKAGKAAKTAAAGA